MEESRNAFKILTGKPTGKRPLERPRRRWENNIRMDLEEVGINADNWVDSAQNRNYLRAPVNAALNLRVLCHEQTDIYIFFSNYFNFNFELKVMSIDKSIN